jgi:hypothetical protein
VPNAQSCQTMQNITNATDFQLAGTSHPRATKATGIAKIIDLMPSSTLKSVNDPTSAKNLTMAASLCATSRCRPRLLVAGLQARFNPTTFGRSEIDVPKHVTESPLDA